jgi:hypothetical protein
MYGARPLKRVIEHQVLNELSKEMLANRISHGDVVKLTFDNNNKKIVFNVLHTGITDESGDSSDNDALATKKLQQHLDTN